MRLTFDRLWIVIAVALPAFVALLVPMPAVDLAYQVRAGDEILATGALPAVDTWTFTVAGMPWVDQQWFSQVLLALGYGVGGWELLAVARAALVAVSTGLLVAAMARGAAPRTASILSLAAFMLMASAMASAAIARDRAVRGAPAAGRGPRLAPAGVRSRPAGGHRLGEHPRGRSCWGRSCWATPGSTTCLPGGRAPRDRWSSSSWARSRRCSTRTGWASGAYAVGIGANPGVTQTVTEWQRTSPLRMPGAMLYPAAIAAFVLLVRGRSRVSLAGWGASRSA